MTAEIITIGDEILIGQVVDSNSAWIAGRLNEAGITLRRITSIGDDPADLQAALRAAGKDADLVIMTGGLGPTRDDRTKQCLCDYFGGRLVVNELVLEQVKQIFSRLNRPMLERNLQQAQVPDNCTVLLNREGTAPGMWFEKAEKVYISLPGVPFEMMSLLTAQVMPRLIDYFADRLQPVLHRSLVTAGVGESFLAELIEPLEDELPAHIRLAYLPRPGLVRLRLSAYGRERQAGSGERRTLEKELDQALARIKELAGKYIIAEEDLRPEEILLRRLKARQQCLVSAESCTGGYIAHLFTSIPGASEVFQGGVISYSNELKMRLLGVDEAILNEKGAVSAETVAAMARGALQRMGGDYAVAVSGIMGPGGGSPEKPVGTAWIAVAGKEDLKVKLFRLSGKRAQLIERTAMAALGMLLDFTAL